MNVQASSTTGAAATPGYRPEIDGLRALAVLAVIFFHAGLPFFGGGYVGVDVFFVISGYLITTIVVREAQAGTFSIAGFYERRARRILPALFLVLATCSVPAVLWLAPHELVNYAQSVVSTVLFFSNFHYMTELGYFGTRGDLKPLLHTWSLAVEEQYYLFTPLFFMLLWRRGGVRVLTLAVAGLALVSMLVAEWGARQWPDVNFFLTPSRIWELMIGALAALATVQPGQRPTVARPLAEVLSVAGLAAIAAAVVFYDDATPFPSLYGLLPTLGTALVLLFAGTGTLVATLLSARIAVGVGLVSYSAYLWHNPLFVFARLIEDGEPSPAVYSGLIALTFVLAYLSWRFVERPFRDRRKWSRRQVFRLSGAATLLIAACGVGVALSGGLPGRFGGKETAFFADLQKSSGDCQKGLDYNLGLDAPCVVGDRTQAPSIVIFGDSHGWPVGEGLGPLLAAQHRSAIVFGQGRCPPMAGTMALGIPRDDRRCLRFVDKVLAAIDGMNDVSTIILASRWERYAYSTTFLPLPGLDVPSTGTAFEAGLAATVRRLSRDGRRIVVVRQATPLPFDAEARMFDRLTGKVEDGPVTFPLSRKAYDGFASNIAIDRLAGVPGLTIFDPYPVFCDGGSGECLAGKDGKPYYRDDNHLVATGAALLGAALMRSLETLPAQSF